MRVLGALIPPALALVAYRVYRSEQWWKRAQWALDAATDDSLARRRLGKKATASLGELDLAPPADRKLFNDVTAEDIEDRLGGFLDHDPETHHDRTAVDGGGAADR